MKLLLLFFNVAISKASELPPHRMALLPLVIAKIATFQLYAVTLLSGLYHCVYYYLSVATETTSGGFCSFLLGRILNICVCTHAHRLFILFALFSFDAKYM